MLFRSLIKNNDIAATMDHLVHNQTRVQLSVLVEIITALGIIWLAVLFYHLLRGINQSAALTALAFYILEAAMLLMSRFCGYILTELSGTRALNADPSLETFGQTLLHTKEFIGNALLIPFGVGAMIFYYLLLMSKTLPSWLPVWGLIAVVPVTIVSILAVGGIKIPFVLEALMVPYVPFEFFAGAYILLNGLRLKS